MNILNVNIEQIKMLRINSAIASIQKIALLKIMIIILS